MSKPIRTPASAAMSDTVLALFRVNSSLLTEGDRLVADLGLTSARWQVLGTIVAAGRPQPVAWLARDMGGNRQNVQRIVNDLERDGFVTFAPNPHHRRASLVVLTDKGQDTFRQAIELETPWMNTLTQDIALDDIAAMQRVLVTLQAQLNSKLPEEEAP